MQERPDDDHECPKSERLAEFEERRPFIQIDIGAHESFEERLRPETRQTLSENREILKEAERVRATTREAEEELLRWEARVRAERPIGTKWAEALDEAKGIVAKISLKLVTELERQREALCHFRAAHASIRSIAARDRLEVPEKTLAALARSEKLRAEAVEASQLALQQSQALLDVEARRGPGEILPILARRRRLFGDAETMLRGSLNSEVEARTAADGGVTKAEWDAKRLREEVDALRRERRTYERRIKYLEETKTELEKARDEALAMVARERIEKAKLPPMGEPKKKRPNGKLNLRLSPTSRIETGD